MQKPDVKISVSLPRHLAEQLADAAEEFDLTTGAVVREALTQFFKTIPNDANTINFEVKKAEPQAFEIAPFKRIFVSAVNSSSNWPQLQSKLRQDDLEVAPKGGGLVLRFASTKEDICKASEAGIGYSGLIRKFKSGFPNHPHKWLAARILSEKSL